MNPSAWRHYYEQNRCNRPEPAWDSPCTLENPVRRELARSLSHFQLGETGGGSFLLRQAEKERAEADDLAALGYFVAEEQEHARLLACMVRRLGGKLVARHWTHRLFKTARRAGSFRFEIQMLLTAEIVGTAYYEMVRAATQDGPVCDAVGLMLRDEARHVAFHLDRLSARWRSYFPLERGLWALQFQFLLHAAQRAAWLDHGPCLRALGFTWADFAGRTRELATGFLDGLRVKGACAGCLGASLPARYARPGNQ